MGPRLGSRGKLLETAKTVGRITLQWGRDLEVAESGHVPTGQRKRT